MYALSFDMNIAELEKYYGNPYHGAYYEIKRTLVKHGFYWIQGSTYMTNADNLLNLFNAVNALKAIDWFASLCATFAATALRNGRTSPNLSEMANYPPQTTIHANNE
jgi:virulence-associated protein VapD